MNAEVIYNSDLHFEHMQWKKELLFLKDEIRSFQNRLKELIDKWSDEKILAEMGQYQIRFDRFQEKFDKMMRAIDSHEHSIAKHYEVEENCLDRVLLKLHQVFREKLISQRKEYQNLKHKFFMFLTHYM